MAHGREKRRAFRSADEEELAIFGERPHFVLDDEFEFVDVVADGVQERLDLVVVGHGEGADVGETIHLFALFHHLLNGIDDEIGVEIDFFDERDVVGAELCGFLGRKGRHDLAYIVDQHALVLGGDGNDVVHAQIAQDAAFDLDLFVVDLALDLVAGGEFVARHDVHAFEHAHGILVGVAVVDDRAAGFAVEAAAGGFGLPLFAVAVAVEMDGAAGADVVAQGVEEGFFGALAGGYEGIDAHLEVGERFGHGGVEHNEGAGAVGRRADGAKLEAVAGEGEGRGAVAVGVVDEEFGNLGNVELHALFACHGSERVGRLCDAVEEFAHLLTQERGDDGGRGFVTAEAVGVARAHDAGFQQAVVAIDAHERGDNEGEEAKGVAFGAAGGVKNDAGVGAERPVAVFSAAVDAGEGFLVE